MRSKDGCGACEVGEAAVLCGGGEATLPAFAGRAVPHPYRVKQTLYHEDTPALGLHVVCSGRIKVSRTEGNGREQVLRIVDPGEILGEECLLEGSRYVGSAQALEDSRVAFLSREDVLRLLQTHPGMAVQLLVYLCRVLASTQTRLARIAWADARSRMAGLLLDLGRRYGRDTREGLQVCLNLSRGELGAMVGLTPETTMRLLSDFRTEGILRTDGRAMTLVQPERLEALV